MKCSLWKRQSTPRDSYEFPYFSLSARALSPTFEKNFNELVKLSQITLTDWLGVQQNSEYVEAVNFHLAKLDESGVYYRLWQLWTYQPLEEFGFEEAISLGYDNITFPSFFLFFGIPGGALIFLLERLSSRPCGKARQNKSVFAPRRHLHIRRHSF